MTMQLHEGYQNRDKELHYFHMVKTSEKDADLKKTQ